MGLTTPASISPRELARISVNHFGESAKPLAAWLIQLEEIRYRAQMRNTDMASLRSGLKSIAWPVK